MGRHKKLKPEPNVPIEVTRYRKDAIKASKELQYGPEVVKKIRRATTVCQIGNILYTAREDQDAV